jgi:(4-O-methyl)-D-glucuronate---lignin esterase
MSDLNKLVLTACSIFLSFITVSALAQDQETKPKKSWQARPELCSNWARRNARILYEEKVPEYTLSNPLVMSDGTKVTSDKMWQTKRRPEIAELFRKHVHGRAPIGRPKEMTFKVFDPDSKALNGLAVRRQVTVNFTGKPDGPSMDILIYLPAAAKKPVPTFVLLNFYGNHTIHPDPAIKLSSSWMHGSGRGIVDHRATEESRGSNSARFPVEKILSRGYGLATIYYGDLDPDVHDGFKNGVHEVFDKLIDGKRLPDAWGSICAWAWGLSRAMDYFESDDEIDHKHIAVLGHSRLGKASLWAGARDERFALVISNNAGCGGATLSMRCFGQTVKLSNISFPHWFCDNFRKFDDKEDMLPVDQHSLIALMAPRPVYVASADKDLWADPRGQFLSCKNAEPVYHLLGLKGLEVEDMPALDSPVQKGKIGYHIRTGSHALTEYDWQQYMDFADKHFKGH